MDDDMEKGMGAAQDSSANFIEEETKQLIEDEEWIDDSLFQGREKNDPLIVEKKELDRIKGELAKALAARADKSKKTTKKDE